MDIGQVSSGLLYGSVLPLLGFLAFMIARGLRKPYGMRSASAAIFFLGGLSTFVTWFGGGLGHIDCGNYCADSVPSYLTIGVTTAALGGLWLVIGLICMGIARRAQAKLAPTPPVQNQGQPQWPEVVTAKSPTERRAAWLKLLIGVLVVGEVLISLLYLAGGLFLLGFGGSILPALGSILLFADAFVVLTSKRRLPKYMLVTRAVGIPALFALYLLMGEDLRQVYTAGLLPELLAWIGLNIVVLIALRPWRRQESLTELPIQPQTT
jgi:hypothetical protein